MNEVCQKRKYNEKIKKSKKNTFTKKGNKMIYMYKCINKNCISKDRVVEISCPMSESSKEKYCKLSRI